GFGSFNNGQLVSGNGITLGQGTVSVNGVNRITRKGQVMDGLSNTLLIQESSACIDWYIHGVFQQGGVRAQLAQWLYEKGNTGVVRGADPNVKTLNDSPNPANLTCAMNCDNNQQSTYSFHTGGCNLLFGDGSVHFIQQGIDVGLFCALA